MPRCHREEPAFTLPALLQLAGASQYPAHDCHGAKGHSSTATIRSFLAEPQQGLMSLEEAQLGRESPIDHYQLPGNGNY